MGISAVQLRSRFRYFHGRCEPAGLRTRLPCGGENEGPHLPSVPEALNQGLSDAAALSNQLCECAMSNGKISEQIDRRRCLVGAATMTVAACLGMTRPTHSQPSLPLLDPRTNTSFGGLKQVNAGVLNVAYAEAGPADGPPVILLHGWPYDIHAFVDVAPLLASAGYRVIIPYLRGYGTTRFLSNETVRNGQPSAVGADVIALMDALKLEK